MITTNKAAEHFEQMWLHFQSEIITGNHTCPRSLNFLRQQEEYYCSRYLKETANDHRPLTTAEIKFCDAVTRQKCARFISGADCNGCSGFLIQRN